MPRPPSHRTRFTVGLAVALVAGVAAGWLATRAARERIAERREERRAVASALALVDLVERAGGQGDAVREALRRWQEQAAPATSARVVLTSGARLEASTAPADQGERAAPRRLARDEKEVFDRARAVAQAVQGNAEGAAARPELLRERTAAGLRLTAPLSAEDRVVGSVEVEVPPPPGVPASPVAPLLALVLPLGIFLAVRPRLPEARGPVAAAAFACLALGLAGIGAWAWTTLGAERRLEHEAVAAHVKALAARSAEIASALGLPAGPAPRPGDWDADLFRRPLGLLAADGAVDPVRAAALSAGAGREVLGAALAIAALAALLLAAVGFGLASRLGAGFQRNRAAYLYVLPAMLGMLVLVFFPFFYGIALSFTSQNLYNVNEPLTSLWVGLRNYSAILGDFQLVRVADDGARVVNYGNFYWTLFFTIVWTVTNVAIGVSVGLALALVLNVKGLALRPVYRVILILPWATPNYITALIWRGMFNQQYGVINQALQLVGLSPIAWSERPLTSFLTALAANGWLSFPFMMVVSLGALQSIPADLYEAARVDGATRWQQFRSITLPSLKPALVPAVILSVVWTFNMFNLIYLVTAGEPGGATEILVTQAYKLAFEKYQYGYAAAYATVIFLLLFVYGIFQNRVTRATEGI